MRSIFILARRMRQNNARRMSNGDITDLQVLSQIAWMDEFFLDDPTHRAN